MLLEPSFNRLSHGMWLHAGQTCQMSKTQLARTCFNDLRNGQKREQAHLNAAEHRQKAKDTSRLHERQHQLPLRQVIWIAH